MCETHRNPSTRRHIPSDMSRERMLESNVADLWLTIQEMRGDA